MGQVGVVVGKWRQRYVNNNKKKKIFKTSKKENLKEKMYLVNKEMRNISRKMKMF